MPFERGSFEETTIREVENIKIYLSLWEFGSSEYQKDFESFRSLNVFQKWESACRSTANMALIFPLPETSKDRKV